MWCLTRDFPFQIRAFQLVMIASLPQGFLVFPIQDCFRRLTKTAHDIYLALVDVKEAYAMKCFTHQLEATAAAIS